MHEIAETMRRDLSIRIVNPARTAFQISFSYPDPLKAQAVVRELVTRFIEENLFVERERAQASGDAKSIEIAEHQVGDQLKVLDPASDPQEPFSPNRPAIALAGIALGYCWAASRSTSGSAAAGHSRRREMRRSIQLAANLYANG